MGYVADRWHKTRPGPSEPECGEHKGKVASSTHGQGKRWQARYDDPSGRERTSLWTTKAEAEAEVVKQEAAKQAGSWMDPKAGQVTVRDFALKTWLPAQDVIGRSQLKYEGTLTRYLFPEWGDREIRSIRPSEAAAWQKMLTSKYGLTGASPNRAAICVRSLFRLAVIDRIIPVSPFAGVKAPAVNQTEVDPPDVGEVRKLIDAAYNDRWAAMIETAALTGLRSGELRGLTVDHVNLLRKTIRVERQIVREKGKGLYLDNVKTAAGRRTVPVPTRLVTLLSDYLASYPPRQGGAWEGLVFAMPDGRPIGDSACDYALKSICQKAAVRGRHWHELRHHYASVLIAGGESPKVVQKRMGHKDVTTTLRTYAHLFADADERTRDVLDAAWTEESSAAGGRIPEARGSVVEFPQVSG
ncbi:tyrosine-type recombinase/integrase [Streptomyces sp. NPDC094447]|uniref:tyrosine-type recombinase/integrase n=1 Tax=Streptomyces sp. NPDC094447 TaxID=3366062 RepID=UPI0038098284